jgi:hypothetical protein
MIPVTQTKVVVKNSKDEVVVRGNCFAASIASLIELPLPQVPNVEVLFGIEGSYWIEVMCCFLTNLGYDLSSDDRFRVFHEKNYGKKEKQRYKWMKECRNKYYIVFGESPRGFRHSVIYKNGLLAHDPHPSREGIILPDYFMSLEKLK